MHEPWYSFSLKNVRFTKLYFAFHWSCFSSPINTSIAPETLSKALHFSTKIHSFGRNALPRLGSAQLLNIIPDYSIPRDLLPRRHFLFCVHTLRLPSLCRPPHPYTIQVGVQCVFALQKIMQFVSVAFTPDPPYCFYWCNLPEWLRRIDVRGRVLSPQVIKLA